jgi:hypothetical protein
VVDRKYRKREFQGRDMAPHGIPKNLLTLALPPKVSRISKIEPTVVDPVFNT